MLLYLVAGYLCCGCIFLAWMVWRISQDEELLNYLDQSYEHYQGWMSKEGFIFTMCLVAIATWLPLMLVSLD